MTTAGERASPPRARAALLGVIALFLALQLATIDYGTRINDLPYVADYQVEEDVAAGSGLERPTIAGAGAGESLDRWMTRFKLYSLEADEPIQIMALARIKPAELAFDPHVYMYGGAWLYPLGLWYFALSKLGLLEVAPLQTLLASPDLMDDIYVWGRVLKLLAVAAAGVVLHRALRLVADPWTAVLGLAVFLFAPATIMFSAVIKPHWYGLLWANLALLAVVQGWRDGRFGALRQAAAGVAVGLAVGTANTYGLFALGLWAALAWQVRAGGFPAAALLSVPAVAVAAYAAANPYVFLNWQAYRAESAANAGWFAPEASWSALWGFLENSLAPGFGVAFSVVLLALAVRELAAGRQGGRRLLASGLLLALALVAFLTASLADWHTNVRYVAWLLPVGLVFLAGLPERTRQALMGGILVFGMVQAAPLKLAYFDENDDARSTRFAAAQWIAGHVPEGSALCLGTPTPAPYDAPPIDFQRYDINAAGCRYIVTVERQADSAATPAGHVLERRFSPRLSPDAFPLVFGHINPQISIYRRCGADGEGGAPPC